MRYIVALKTDSRPLYVNQTDKQIYTVLSPDEATKWPTHREVMEFIKNVTTPGRYKGRRKAIDMTKAEVKVYKESMK